MLPANNNACDLALALDVLRAGEAMAFETDTVVGLGVAPGFAQTPQVLYDIKHRDADKPIAWLIDGVEMLKMYARDLPPVAIELARRFWPGALTIVARASDAAPAAFVSKAGTLGFRAPAQSPARDLLEALGFPIATTSANLSGTGDVARIGELALPSANIKFYESSAGADVSMAPCASTVIDCTVEPPVILREGQIPRVAIVAVTG
jgi:tRNA threonylcarbamoyl adenosine modification protein (Sua5/YciO/YrdC/YwlC family)